MVKTTQIEDVIISQISIKKGRSSLAFKTSSGGIIYINSPGMSGRIVSIKGDIEDILGVPSTIWGERWKTVANVKIKSPNGSVVIKFVHSNKRYTDYVMLEIQPIFGDPGMYLEAFFKEPYETSS